MKIAAEKVLVRIKKIEALGTFIHEMETQAARLRDETASSPTLSMDRGLRRRQSWRIHAIIAEARTLSEHLRFGDERKVPDDLAGLFKKLRDSIPVS